MVEQGAAENARLEEQLKAMQEAKEEGAARGAAESARLEEQLKELQEAKEAVEDDAAAAAAAAKETKAVLNDALRVCPSISLIIRVLFMRVTM